MSTPEVPGYSCPPIAATADPAHRESIQFVEQAALEALGGSTTEPVLVASHDLTAAHDMLDEIPETNALGKLQRFCLRHTKF